MDQLSDRIKKIREDRGVSQEIFARSIGTHQAHLSKLERGKAKPSKRILKAISMLSGLREEWLLSGKGEKFIELEEIPAREFKWPEEYIKDNAYLGMLKTIASQTKLIKHLEGEIQYFRNRGWTKKEGQQFEALQEMVLRAIKIITEYQAALLGLIESEDRQEEAKNAKNDRKSE